MKLRRRPEEAKRKERVAYTACLMLILNECDIPRDQNVADAR